eukprot:TRINITY_DN33321_c0_g1_i1.p1 TRINITY_DN33321_c0_g1~~TRINITY_DN33321_c0_g1_i1.p1  ORF type:complete len:495 (-),score=46.80 TRINITY_DN33321_c0_g1_i1:198-1502(-)
MEIAKSAVAHSVPALPLVAMDVLPDNNFGAALLEAALEVRVNAVALHIHLYVLRKIPFFAALLDGTWRDKETPHVQLPCSVCEFILLLKRLYTGELLGSPALPVPSCEVALRLGAAAAMLLIEDCLPELPGILRTSIKTAGDAELAEHAAGALPDSLNAALQGVCGKASFPSIDLSLLLDGATTAGAQQAAQSILAARRGHIETIELVNAVDGVLKRCQNSYPSQDEKNTVRWALNLACEHLSCAEVTRIFQNLKYQHMRCSSGCTNPESHLQQGWLVTLRNSFGEHLVRSAKEGDLKEVLELCIDRRFSSNGVHCCWEMTQGHVPIEAHALAQVLRVAPGSRGIIAEYLSNTPQRQTSDILSENLITDLGAHVETVIAHLAKSPNDAFKWASVPRLDLLSRASRRVLCAQLTPFLAKASPELVVAITEALTQR